MLRKTQIRALKGLKKSRKENTMDEMIVFENGNKPVITKEVLDQIAVIDTQMKFYDTQYKALKEQLKEKMEASPLGAAGWQTQICAASGVSEKLLAELLAGRKKLTIQTAKKLVPYLFDEMS